MARNYSSSSPFGEKDHVLFTTDVLAGIVPAAHGLHPYDASHMLSPVWLLGESVQNMADRIVRSYRRYSEQGRERVGNDFIDEYHEGLEDKIARYQEPGAAKDIADYDDQHVPTLTYQQSVFDDPDPFLYLMRQWPQAVLGKYIELTLARIFNGTIIDLHGTSPDIAIQTRDGIIYIESKSARYSNGGKYISPAGNVRSVSRHGFFAKRQQIYSALRTENNTPNITNYMALVDYDFVGGENIPFNAFTKECPETFGKIQYEHDLKSLPERLRETVVIKSILIVPTWAAYMAWNANIMRTRPIDKFQQGRIYQNESHPVAQYFMPGHIDLMKRYLTDKWVQKNMHTVAWLQDTSIQIETFGHAFLPFESITL